MPEEDESQDKGKPFYKNNKILAMMIGVAILLAIASAYMIQTPEGLGTTEETAGNQTNVANLGETTTLSYIVRANNGSIIEEDELEFKLGSQDMLKEINEAVVGMRINETKEIQVEELYGPEEIVEALSKNELEKALNETELEENESYSFQGEKFKIEEIQDEVVLISFENQHPHAGETMTIEITLQDIGTPKLNIEEREKPTVSLHIMSQCTHGDYAIETMKPVYELLGDKVNWNIHYIMNEEEGEVTSQFGEKELEQNSRELCVLEKHGVSKWFDFAIKSSEIGWENAAKEIKLEVQNIEECTEEKGEEILMQEAKKTEETEVVSSPTLYVNGEKRNEVYDYGEPNKYKDVICTGFKSPPQECEEELPLIDIQGPSGSC